MRDGWQWYINSCHVNSSNICIYQVSGWNRSHGAVPRLHFAVGRPGGTCSKQTHVKTSQSSECLDAAGYLSYSHLAQRPFVSYNLGPLVCIDLFKTAFDAKSKKRQGHVACLTLQDEWRHVCKREQWPKSRRACVRNCLAHEDSVANMTNTQSHNVNIKLDYIDLWTIYMRVHVLAISAIQSVWKLLNGLSAYYILFFLPCRPQPSSNPCSPASLLWLGPQLLGLWHSSHELQLLRLKRSRPPECVRQDSSNISNDKCELL